MNNSFFNFVENYWEDIVAFFTALRNLVETLIGKLGSSDDDETTGE